MGVSGLSFTNTIVGIGQAASVLLFTKRLTKQSCHLAQCPLLTGKLFLRCAWAFAGWEPWRFLMGGCDLSYKHVEDGYKSVSVKFGVWNLVALQLYTGVSQWNAFFMLFFLSGGLGHRICLAQTCLPSLGVHFVYVAICNYCIEIGQCPAAIITSLLRKCLISTQYTFSAFVGVCSTIPYHPYSWYHLYSWRRCTVRDYPTVTAITLVYKLFVACTLSRGS